MGREASGERVLSPQPAVHEGCGGPAVKNFLDEAHAVQQVRHTAIHNPTETRALRGRPCSAAPRAPARILQMVRRTQTACLAAFAACFLT